METPPLTWCLPLLVLLLPLAIPRPSAAVNDTSTLTCFYNSRANISCVWSQHGVLQATGCQVHAQPHKRRWNETCDLFPTRFPESWACNLILGPPNSQRLTAVDVVNISVRCRKGKRWWIVTSQEFKPFENLRLMAPDSLQVVHLEAHRCNVTWILPQFSHYIERYLEFEVRTQPLGHSWESASLLTLGQNQQWIYLETLAPDTSYELQVRARAHQGSNTTWSPWSQPLAFRTRPEAPGKTSPLPWLGHMLIGLSGGFAFIILVYLLANCRYIGPWLKKALKCHIPDPSEFFSQLSTEHGGDFQKWLSSPFPSSSFSPSGPAPEISPLEVLERDTKATQLLLQSQDKAPAPSPSSHSHTSCFTNQGYFFFHLPDALEIESCQVYFTYDPCAEEPSESRPGASMESPLPALPSLSGENDAYCTFPPGEDLLLFSPNLAGPGPKNTALGGSGAGEERLPSSPQGGVTRDSDSRPLGPPAPGAPNPVAVQSFLEQTLREAGEEVPGPGPGPGEGASSPWATLPRQGQARALTPCLAPNTDAYVSLQELQDQDPAHLA
ncbi:interleukin-2 receptor subunit beta [Orycteropus afer afer]|uniref:Interleukin-2 receptor subunit beta n=1 Tax=Orycteropus afer afer TaxID=1230840 RepID=A0A8B7A135_ORYAF|nr:interleukin-2 receptor subunit beta [Orycteropus afer afer]